MTARRLTIIATGVALIALAGPAGWALERALRPPLAGGHPYDELAGRLRAGEHNELQDRVVRAWRSGASVEDVEAATKPLRRAGSQYALTPEAITARRAAWWRARISRSHRELVIAEARNVGFTDDELDLIPRSWHREMDLLERVADASVPYEEARAWASTLAVGSLTTEAATTWAARMAGPGIAPDRRELVAVALAGTRSPAVLETWWKIVSDRELEVGVRILALEAFLAGDPPLGHREVVADLLLDADAPMELRIAALRVSMMHGSDRSDPVTRAAIVTLALDAGTPSPLREGALDAVLSALADHSNSTLLAIARDTSVPVETRSRALRRLTPSGTGDEEWRAVLAAMAASPTEPESLRRAARLSLEAARRADRRRESLDQ